MTNLARRPAGPPLLVELVRVLREEDLPQLHHPPPQGTTAPSLKAVQHQHHQIAQLLAQGMKQVQVSLVTGISQSRISILKGDPTFQELMAYYSSQRELVFVDVLEKMKVLGLSSLDEMQRRLDEAPEDLSNRELMELTKLTLVDGRAAPGSRQGAAAGFGAGGPGPSGVTVNVKFVGPTGGKDIDGELLHD
jgi:hypothetical protein